MKRYCLLGDLEADDFPQKDKAKFIDVNIDEIIQHIVESKTAVCNIPLKADEVKRVYGTFFGIYSYVNGETLDSLTEKNILIENRELISLWESIFYSVEYKLDILEEIYLILSYIQNKQVNLYFEDSPDINEKMIQAIKNVKKSNKESDNRIRNSYTYIFDMSKINSASKKAKIPEFGSGIVRMWLNDKRFRKLFVETEISNEKYRPQEISNILETNEQLGIKFNRSDCIILEKLLGVSTEYTLYEYVISILESKVNAQRLCLLIDKLMKINGERSRCVMIQYMGFDLYSLKYRIRKNDENERMLVYQYLVQIFERMFNEVYKETVKIVLREYIKYFPISTCVEKVMNKLKVLSNLGRPAYLNNLVYQSFIKKKSDRYYIDKIIRSKDEEQQLMLLSQRDELDMVYIESNSWRKGCFDTSRDDEDIRIRIQKEIIVDNYKKYS